MKIRHMKMTVAAAWVVSVAFLGYAAGTASPISWLLLAAVALAPPLIIAHFWQEPAQSMSESIHDVLR